MKYCDEYNDIPQYARLAERGFVVAAMEYRESYLMGNSSGGHIAMMSVLFSAHGLCDELPGVAGVISESGSTDLLICAAGPLPPVLLSTAIRYWM